MAFTSMHDQHLDEMRFSSGQHHDSPKFPAYTPLRSSTDLSSHPTTPDARMHLQRRYTTDTMMASPIPTSWDTSRLRHKPATDSLDHGSAGHGETDDRQRVQLMLQQKQIEYESRRQEQKKYEAHMHLLELQNRRDEAEMLHMAQNLDRMAIHSEPTTPPEFREGAFIRSKPGLSVASALATPPAAGTRLEQQQLITPPAEDVLAMLSQSHVKSVPQSRRNSDESKSNVQAPIGGHRSARNSLSSNIVDRPQISSGPSRFGIKQVNTDFLFDEDEKIGSSSKGETKSPDVKTYLKMMDTKENFPILTSASNFPGKLSASSAALDLALSQKIDDQEKHQNPWGSFQRSHRPSQHSLPSNGFPFTPNGNSSPKAAPQTDSSAVRRYERSQTDFPYAVFSENLNAQLGQTEATHAQQSSVPKLQASFSTSDLPTMRNINSIQSNTFNRRPIDRQRHSRESSLNSSERTLAGPPISFGPPLPANIGTIPVMSPPGMSPLPSPSVYGGYGHISMGNPVFHAASFGPYPLYGQNKTPENNHQNHNTQPRNVQKRTHEGETNRFANVKLESLVNEIYSLCKDQHGCRYLQKKLEEGNPQYVQMIFLETHTHVVELMTDPFGNYLCQKLLEYADNEQRTVLVNTAAPRLVDIALNQHGTRALQKMIEFLSTPEQIDTIVHALQNKVVDLIQDLNGNHVIQKCLNRLRATDAQFIFDAVGEHCIPVGTHRHGCCVLQRCIDHASGQQRIQLIQRITAHSLELVQDAFGNYVVQYILDLGEPNLSEPVIHQFRRRICELARQKFSSNVIEKAGTETVTFKFVTVANSEKCIRVAEPSTKKILIDEMIGSGQIDALLRDNYANYVIQTSIDYADQATRQRLSDCIGPLLPSIRNFPYGRRISSKLAAVESKPSLVFQSGSSSNGQVSSHSRSNSYSATPPRPISLHGQTPVLPTPLQHSYAPSFCSELGTQFRL